MKIKILFLLLFAKSLCAQTIPLTGSVWDDRVRSYLPVKVYGIMANQKNLLGSSVQLGVFEHQYDVQVPLQMDSLIFEIPGYASIRLPVYFHGAFKKNAVRAGLGIEIPAEGEDISQKTYSLLIQPEIGTGANNEFTLYFSYQGKYGFASNLTHILSHSSSTHSSDIFKAGAHQKLTITSPTGEVLTENEFSLKPGINFVDTNIYPQEKAKSPGELTDSTATPEIQSVPVQVQNTPAIHNYPHGIPSIFFDQSKYELKTQGINTLDSLLDYLNHKSGSKITLKGFTDKVGDAGLNTTLARYRAQVVANYLTGKGLNANRINIQWENPQDLSMHAPGDTGLSRYRKVIITESN